MPILMTIGSAAGVGGACVVSITAAGVVVVVSMFLSALLGLQR